MLAFTYSIAIQTLVSCLDTFMILRRQIHQGSDVSQVAWQLRNAPGQIRKSESQQTG
jgi:hypothetical protein